MTDEELQAIRKRYDLASDKGWGTPFMTNSVQDVPALLAEVELLRRLVRLNEEWARDQRRSDRTR